LGASPRPRALFAGTGLGKSFMELAWASAFTARPADILHLAPLAVSRRCARGRQVRDRRIAGSADDCGPASTSRIIRSCSTSTCRAFGGVILDESSILKSTDGHYRTRLIEACQSIPFRLAATATPAPNDFMELGNHAEFLGIMSYTDMLATFFARRRRHAKVAAQRPRRKRVLEVDGVVGRDAPQAVRPRLFRRRLRPAAAAIRSSTRRRRLRPNAETGLLFPMQAETLQERIAARRARSSERVALAASVTPADRPFVWWCNLNAESEAADQAAIPGAVETKGSDPDDVKERKLLDFSEGRTRVLVSKPSVCGFGMNWQHCADTGFVGLNDSFEQFYQACAASGASAKPSPSPATSSRRDRRRDRRQHSPQGSRRRAHGRGDGAHMADLSSEAVRGMVRDHARLRSQQPVKLPAFLEAA
jgi:hypothetical protein